MKTLEKAGEQLSTFWIFDVREKDRVAGTDDMGGYFAG
jgi:hypothetical protein